MKAFLPALVKIRSLDCEIVQFLHCSPWGGGHFFFCQNFQRSPSPPFYSGLSLPFPPLGSRRVCYDSEFKPRPSGQCVLIVFSKRDCRSALPFAEVSSLRVCHRVPSPAASLTTFPPSHETSSLSIQVSPGQNPPLEHSRHNFPLLDVEMVFQVLLQSQGPPAFLIW